MIMRKYYYLLIVYGDVSPEISGPFTTEKARDDKAKEMRAEDEDLENGIYYLEIVADKCPDEVDCGAYMAGFFNDDDDDN
jgi:hypothetical protein